MKLTKTVFFISLALLNLLCTISYAVAYPQALCAHKILDSGETNGIFVKTDEIENRCFAAIKIGDQDWYLSINYDKMGKYNSLIGKPVNVKYQLQQYWNEHDEECVRQEQLVSLIAAGSKAGITQIKSGYFKASTTDAEPVNIFLASNGQGYVTGSGYDNISWKQNCNTLTLKGDEFMDNVAKVISPTSFEIDGITYALDPKYKATTYKYAEKGSSGQMVVLQDSSSVLHINFETIENSSANTCEGQLVCSQYEGKISCYKYGTDEPGAVTLKFAGNTLTVDTTYSQGDFCGRLGSFTGLYKK